MKVRAEIDFDILNAFSIDDFDGNKYLVGCGFIHNDSHIVLDNGDQFPIKKDTRAIHFEDMIDSNSKAIFASLSKNGKGGDMAEYTNKKGTYIGTYMFSQRFTFGIHLELENKTYINVDFEDKNDLENFKAVGINL